MGILANLLISTVATAAAFVGLYHAPLSWFEFGPPEPRVGATITTILGTDTLSASRTVINDNFTALNNGKIENASSSIAAITTLSNLVTVGTLTSGSLGSGFTTVAVARGGTGSTTLSSNQVLLGNGTGNIGVVSGFGSSGQFLTSNGSGAAPTWQTSSVNQADNYQWTGNHNFVGNTYVKNLNASSTAANPIVLNGVSYSFNGTPTQASSTVLMTNGAGALSWGIPTSTAAFGTHSTSTVTNGLTEDKVINVGFRPSYIKLNYYLQCHTNSGGTNVYQGYRGTVLYASSTVMYNNILYAGQTGAADDYPNPALGDFAGDVASVRNTADPTTGNCGGAAGSINVDTTIPAITDTGFTLRTTFGGGGTTNIGRGEYSYEVYK